MSVALYQIIKTWYPDILGQHITADLVADTQSDLPSPTGLTGYVLEIGSRCKVIGDGTSWQMQSSGTWVQQADGLADVYTKQQIDTLLTSYATMTAMQAADAALQADINTRMTADNVFKGTEILSGDDLDNYKTQGRYHSPRGGVTTSLHHRPTGIGNYGMTLEVFSLGGNLVQKITTGGGSAGHIFTRAFYAASTNLWQTWYDFQGNAVGTEN